MLLFGDRNEIPCNMRDYYYASTMTCRKKKLNNETISVTRKCKRTRQKRSFCGVLHQFYFLLYDLCNSKEFFSKHITHNNIDRRYQYETTNVYSEIIVLLIKLKKNTAIYSNTTPTRVSDTL